MGIVGVRRVLKRGLSGQLAIRVQSSVRRWTARHGYRGEELILAQLLPCILWPLDRDAVLKFHLHEVSSLCQFHIAVFRIMENAVVSSTGIGFRSVLPRNSFTVLCVYQPLQTTAS